MADTVYSDAQGRQRRARALQQLAATRNVKAGALRGGNCVRSATGPTSRGEPQVTLAP